MKLLKLLLTVIVKHPVFQFLFQISDIQSGQACAGYDAGRTGPSAAQEKC